MPAWSSWRIGTCIGAGEGGPVPSGHEEDVAEAEWSEVVAVLESVLGELDKIYDDGMGIRKWHGIRKATSCAGVAFCVLKQHMLNCPKLASWFRSIRKGGCFIICAL